jgi:hypothetical protein
MRLGQAVLGSWRSALITLTKRVQVAHEAIASGLLRRWRMTGGLRIHHHLSESPGIGPP